MTEGALDPVELSRTLGQRLGFVRQPDDEKAFADAILAQLATDRLLWAVAPVEVGGFGANISQLARITFNLARLSGSAGLIYAMHMSQAMTVVRHGGDSVFFTDFLKRVVDKQMLVASGTSEKGVGGDIFGSLCSVEQEADGDLVVVKESPNISYLDHAGAILVSAMRPQAKGRPMQVLVAVEAQRLELRPGRATGFLGMRGILNRSYAFTARFKEEAIFPEAYPVIARDTMTPGIHILWASLWSGIACSALDKAKTYIVKETPAEDDVAGLMRTELSRLVDKHYEMNALVRDAIIEFDDRGRGGAMGMGHTARVKRLKTVCSELLQDVCFGSLGLIGIRGYADGGPYSLSSEIRDALSARVMISNYRLLTSNAKIERYLEESL